VWTGSPSLDKSAKDPRFLSNVEQKKMENVQKIRKKVVTLQQNQKYTIIMSRVTIKDKTFETSIPEAEILKHVREVAERINHDYEGKTPLFLAVLNGAFMFAAELMREITIPCEISFVKLASYQGTTSTGKIKEVMGINENLNGRHVIIVEDIVDTGLTMKQMMESLGTRNPASVSICTLLLKPDKVQEDLDIKYAAIEIPNDFIVGHGLDYDQLGRNLRDIYTLVP
jgi:hypoxanthine phosphoribosyltransferase